MEKKKIKETEVAEKIVAWFDGYDVYQEVAFLGCVADIVVDVGGYGHVIETKTTFGMAVLAQADAWVWKGVKRVSIGVPVGKTKPRTFAAMIATQRGIGVLEVGGFRDVNEVVKPQFRRNKNGRLTPDILSVCTSHHKTFCPAGSKSGRWSSFKNTCRQVLESVVESPGPMFKRYKDS